MASTALLAADYAALSRESGRRHPDVRDAADAAHQLLKQSIQQSMTELHADPPPTSHPLYQPIFLAANTKNAKVIALAMSALQRLIMANAVPRTFVRQILDTLDHVISQGVEIQLKVLQILVSLLTTDEPVPNGNGRKRVLVQGEDLGRALELSHRLSTSKIPVVASTASATLRQLFMFVFERVGAEDALIASSTDPAHDAALPPPSFNVDVPPNEIDRARSPSSPTDEEAQYSAKHARARSRSIKLRPAARDAYLLLEDLCLLVAGSVEGGPDGEPSFLRWKSLSRTFGLELVESIVSGFGDIVRIHPELLLVLRAHLCPLLIRFLSSPPQSTLTSSTTFAYSFPLTLRLTRVVFLLLKQFSDLLTLESEIFLTMFVRVVGPGDRGEGEGGHPAGPAAAGQNSPLWMRVLALEIFRGLCSDFTLMMKFYQRYDAVTKEAEDQSSDAKGKGKAVSGGSTFFSDLVTALNRLATEKPAALGTGAAVLYGSSLGPIASSSTAPIAPPGSTSSSTPAVGMTGSTVIDSAMGMGLGLAQVAGSVVGSSVAAAAGAVSTAGGLVASGPSLSTESASMKLQCIDQLDKAEPPPIPDTYLFLLALQCLTALADGFAAYALHAYSKLVRRQQRDQGTAPPALDWASLDSRESAVSTMLVVRAMAESAWPALLASMSFFIGTSLSDDLFSDVVMSLQNFTSVLGILDLETPREAFLTSLCRFAMPPAIVSHIASQADAATGSHSHRSGGAVAAATAVFSAGAESLALLTGAGSSSAPIGLSSRNLACLRALLSVAHFLAGSLGLSWFSVFETLQNADFVLRATAAGRGARKRAVQPAPTATPTPSAAKTSSAAGNAADSHATSISQIPVIPSEEDEQAIQQAMADMFTISQALDDEAFRKFIGALCRLSGEMVGLHMNEDGTLAAEVASVERGEEGGSGARTPLETPDRAKKRSSGIHTAKGHSSAKQDKEQSFGVAKLGVVATLNITRLITHPPPVGWDAVTSHLLYLLHCSAAPASIRLQATDVLTQTLLLALKALANSVPSDDIDGRERVQTLVFAALAELAEPPVRLQTSTDVEIRRMALETLLRILEVNGHALVTGWDRIFHMLRTACPPANLQLPTLPSPSIAGRYSLDTISERDGLGPSTPIKPAGSNGGYFAPVGGRSAGDASARAVRGAALVRTSFPSLQLICTDFLDALSVDELRDCIGTLADFGQQGDDVNVALTAGGLLWNVSDHVQAKQRDGISVEAYGDLWMYLLQNMLAHCRDPRQEVRDASITNVYRSLSVYGSTLEPVTWDACCWNIVFPLLDNLSDTIRHHNEVDSDDVAEEQTVPQPNGPPLRLIDKQWDDSKSLALRSTGDVFFEYLAIFAKTERFEDTWDGFVQRLQDSFIIDQAGPATASMQALEKVLSVALDTSNADQISSSWERAWRAWEAIGADIEHNEQDVENAYAKAYTQVNLETFVRVALSIYTPPYLVFDLPRVQRMLAVVRAALLYSHSPDYRVDIDGLMPLQATVLEVVAAVKLDELPGAAAAVITELSEYVTLAFTASFDAPSYGSVGKAGQRVTYIALTKEVMPHIQWLFNKYRDDPSVYEDGALERVLEAYSLPMSLKHDCPAPAKFGSADPLWKTATICFLKTVRIAVDSVQQLEKLPETLIVAIWERIVDGFAGALRASTLETPAATSTALRKEENFDLSLLVTLEQDVLPVVGSSAVPDDLIRRLGKAIQLASRLHRLDLPPDEEIADDDTVEGVEPRFDPDFDRQACGKLKGTTVQSIEVQKERFAYWNLDTLFMICDVKQAGTDQARCRLAALCAPLLLTRCAAAFSAYVADAPLRGKMPFPRIRQEELQYLLQRLIDLRLPAGTLNVALQSTTSRATDRDSQAASEVRSSLLQSPCAFLYEFYPLFVDLLRTVATLPTVTRAPSYLPRRYLDIPADEEEAYDGLPAGWKVSNIGRLVAPDAEQDLVSLVSVCLGQVGREMAAGAFLQSRED
ncbi:hypothetical protein JCM10908_006780 [Rhodotorula pacifica]|uniref:Mon2p n=1 Tax=Rhodotorula pacifica TaxID=1495444 RepID=UPI00316BC56E